METRLLNEKISCQDLAILVNKHGGSVTLRTITKARQGCIPALERWGALSQATLDHVKADPDFEIKCGRMEAISKIKEREYVIKVAIDRVLTLLRTESRLMEGKVPVASETRLGVTKECLAFDKVSGDIIDPKLNEIRKLRSERKQYYMRMSK